MNDLKVKERKLRIEFDISVLMQGNFEGKGVSDFKYPTVDSIISALPAHKPEHIREVISNMLDTKRMVYYTSEKLYLRVDVHQAEYHRALLEQIAGTREYLTDQVGSLMGRIKHQEHAVSTDQSLTLPDGSSQDIDIANIGQAICNKLHQLVRPYRPGKRTTISLSELLKEYSPSQHAAVNAAVRDLREMGFISEAGGELSYETNSPTQAELRLMRMIRNLTEEVRILKSQILVSVTEKEKTDPEPRLGPEQQENAKAIMQMHY